MKNIGVGLVVFALGLSAHLGCESGGTKSYTLEEFKVAVAEERCAALVKCGTHATQEDCAHHQLSIEQLHNFNELSLAIEEERIVFDGAAAFECAAAIGDPTCRRSSQVDVPTECDAIFTNGLAKGEECLINQECETGLECDSLLFPSCIRRVCTDPNLPTEDSACEEDCEVGLYCEKFSPGNPQSTGICEAYALAGESCNASGAMRARQCVAGYGCVDELCVPLPLTGEVCDPQIGCEVINDRCPRGVGIPDPATCEAGRPAGSECIDLECMWNSYCADGVCTKFGDIDETCDVQTFCQYPLFCRRGVCGNRYEPEEVCES